jgi:hypothetical protein
MNPLRNFPAAKVSLVLMVNWGSCALAQTWTLTAAPTNEFWQAIASSADGSKLVAVSSNGIYASTNGGMDWTHASAPATNWSGVAFSADGIKSVAVAYGGPIYISADAGSTWKASAAPSNSWQAVACSGDGSKLVVAYGIEFASGGIYTSTNFGVNWTPSDAPTNGYGWYSVSSSADGIKLAAMLVDELTPAGPYGWIYTSTNAGTTWTQSTRIRWPTFLTSSADGNKLAAAIGKGFLLDSPILTSTNFGATWATSTIVNAWASIACSADGTRLIAATGGLFPTPNTGPIYLSADSGATWTASDSPTNSWGSVASSADGNKLVAAVNGGGIYTWQTTPAPVLSIINLSSNLVLAWTVPSMAFVLQQTPDLANSNWTNVAAGPTLNSITLQYRVATPPPRGATFYRLVSQ